MTNNAIYTSPKQRAFKTLRAQILKEHDHKCFYCGAHAYFCDHVIPASKGGPDTYDNLVPVCTSCNPTAHDKIFKNREEKKAFIIEHRMISCGRCEKRFLPKRIWQVFCGRQCANRHRLDRYIKAHAGL